MPGVSAGIILTTICFARTISSVFGAITRGSQHEERSTVGRVHEISDAVRN